MTKTLLLQAVGILLAAVLAGLLAGAVGAKSAFAGGVAYFLPNLLFVLRLRFAIVMKQAGAVGFLVGEAMKLAAVIVLLMVLPRIMEVDWPALIAGLFVVLFVNLFSLLLKN